MDLQGQAQPVQGWKGLCMLNLTQHLPKVSTGLLLARLYEMTPLRVH